MEEDKDMKNENEDEEIENAEFDGGVVSMSASGMTYKSKDNEIETVEYVWKANRAGLYSRLAGRINEKLNTAIQGLEYEGMIDPVVLYFSTATIAHHFYNQLVSHGWSVTLDQDDVIQVDVVASVDKMSKDDQSGDDIGDDGFFDDSILSLH